MKINIAYPIRQAHKRLLACLTLSCMGITIGHAAVEIVFDSTGIIENAATYDSASNTTELQSASWTRGAGLDAKDGVADYFNSWSVDSGSLADAITGDDYYSVTITPNQAINLQDIQIDANQGPWQNSPQAVLMSDLTGFTSGNEIAQLSLDGISDSIDLTSIPELQSISDPVEFRVYYWGFKSWGRVLLGNVTISGTAVPTNSLTSEQKAARFLTQATMGPTYQEIVDLAADIDTLGEDAALEAWIDNQINNATRSRLEDIYDALAASQSNVFWPDGHKIWWTNAIDGQDQLRRRVNFALHQILVTSILTNKSPQAQSIYYDMLGDHAFGNYRDILYDVTLSPLMGNYLSHLKNAKADPVLGTNPDENYAREIMQLFSIGLYELENNGLRKTDGNGNEIPTYTNDQITEFAEVFTGFGFNKAKSWQNMNNAPKDYTTDMFMYDEEHDTSEKVLLDYPGAVNGGVIAPFTNDPAVEQEGLADVNFAVDNLFNHPNVGPFIARLLIQHMVTSNPTTDYVEAVANAFNGTGTYATGVRGDMTAVVKTILLHDEARSAAMLEDTEHGKLMDPASRLVNLGRALGIQKPMGDDVYQLSYMDGVLGMQPLASPSVFNFYLPDFQPSGAIETAGLVGPEFEILTAVFAMNIPNQWKEGVESGLGRFDADPLDLSELETLVNQNGDTALVDRLDLVFCRGLMSQDTYDEIVSAISGLSTDSEKVQLAVYLTLFSAESAILR